MNGIIPLRTARKNQFDFRNLNRPGFGFFNLKLLKMKKFFSVIPIIASILLISTMADPLTIGSPIPRADSKLKDINGKEVSFKELIRKNGLLVMFSCNTCPVVAKYEKRTLDVAKVAVKNDVGIILLNSNEATRGDGDSYDDMKSYARNLGYSFHYVIDNKSEMADAFGANRTPECFLFNKEGKLVYRGAIDDNPGDADQARPYLKMAIENLAKGDKIDPETTRSVGCTIKRAK